MTAMQGDNVLAIIDAARRRYNIGLGLDLAARWLSWWLYAVAVGVVVLKVTGYHEVFRPVWLLATVAGLLPGYALAMRRRGMDRLQAAAWVDCKACAGGTVLAAVERPDLAVAAVADAARGTPAVAPGPALGTLALPALFLVAAWIVPGVSREPPASAASIRRRAAEVERRIEKAGEFGILPDEEVARLVENSRDIADEAEESPEAAAEGVDALQGTLDQRILEEAKREFENLRAAADLEAALGEGDPTDPEARRKALQEALAAAETDRLPEELRKELEKMMRKLGAQSADGLKGLPKSALDNLDPERLREMMKALRKAGKKGGAACKKGRSLMSGAEARERLKQMMKGMGKLSEMGDPMAGHKRLMPGGKGGKPGKKPGRGGVTRGRGDADLHFGDETDESKARFQSSAMQPGEGFVPGVTLNRSKRRPSEIAPEEFQPPARTGRRVEERVRGRRAGAPLGPYRRGVAERYFTAPADERDDE